TLSQLFWLSLYFLPKKNKTTNFFFIRVLISSIKKCSSISSSLSISSLISVFPLCSISSSDHHSLVSTHPQSNTVAPLVTLEPHRCVYAHQSAVLSFTPQQSCRSHPSQSIGESVTKPHHDRTCSKSSISSAFLLQNNISFLFRSRCHQNHASPSES